MLMESVGKTYTPKKPVQKMLSGSSLDSYESSESSSVDSSDNEWKPKTKKKENKSSKIGDTAKETTYLDTALNLDEANPQEEEEATTKKQYQGQPRRKKTTWSESDDTMEDDDDEEEKEEPLKKASRNQKERKKKKKEKDDESIMSQESFSDGEQSKLKKARPKKKKSKWDNLKIIVKATKPKKRDDGTKKKKKKDDDASIKSSTTTKTKEKLKKGKKEKMAYKVEENVDAADTKWKYLLKGWDNETKRGAKVKGASISMAIPPFTDNWRKTRHNIIVDNAPFHWQKVTGNFEAIVKISGSFATMYDKAGIKVRLDAENWIFAGMELFNQRLYASVLATIDHTDWSMAPLPQNAEKVGIWFCFKRFGDAYETFYSKDGSVWVQTRQGMFTDKPTLYVGVCGACPMGEKDFNASFDYYRCRSFK